MHAPRKREDLGSSPRGGSIRQPLGGRQGSKSAASGVLLFTSFMTHKDPLDERLRASRRKHYHANKEQYVRRNIEGRERRAEHVLQAKRSPCVDCKKTFPEHAMEFDRIDGSECKVNSAAHSSWGRLRDELARCEVVCGDCLGARVARRRRERATAYDRRRQLAPERLPTSDEIANLLSGLTKVDECLLWSSSNRYRRARIGGRKIDAHRALLEYKLGRLLSADEEARHTCDRMACLNQGHLIPGTHLDNVRDAVERKRNAFGSANGNALFTDETARSLLAAHSFLGLGPVDLGPMFGVGRTCASDIVNGVSWKHIDRSPYPRPEGRRARPGQRVRRKRPLQADAP